MIMKDLVLLGLNSHERGPDGRVVSKRIRMLVLLTMCANAVNFVLALW